MRKIMISCVIMCLLLTGCTYDANRIYTVCKTDEDETYVYSDDGLFLVNCDKLIESYDPNVVREPALQLLTDADSYKFSYEMPGLYKGTLYSVSGYINYMCENDDASYVITYSDPNNLEVFLNTDDYMARVIYNTNGEVRMYFKNKSGFSINPVYVNEEIM